MANAVEAETRKLTSISMPPEVWSTLKAASLLETEGNVSFFIRKLFYFWVEHNQGAYEKALRLSGQSRATPNTYPPNSN